MIILTRPEILFNFQQSLKEHILVYQVAAQMLCGEPRIQTKAVFIKTKNQSYHD